MAQQTQLMRALISKMNLELHNHFKCSSAVSFRENLCGEHSQILKNTPYRAKL
jgi:hypothetical protein